MSDLRTRIAATIQAADRQIAQEDEIATSDYSLRVADAVIRELDGVLVDWGVWLAEEMTGQQMTRLDMEGCLTDWKADE